MTQEVLYGSANDPRITNDSQTVPQMIPGPQMIPMLYWTANDPGTQIIPILDRI